MSLTVPTFHLFTHNSDSLIHFYINPPLTQGGEVEFFLLSVLYLKGRTQDSQDLRIKDTAFYIWMHSCFFAN